MHSESILPSIAPACPDSALASDLEPATACQASSSVALARRERARLARQAMTLIEIMIVVVIMALVATGVGIAVIPQLQKAKIQDTRAAVQTVRSAVTLYIATNNADCATMDQLIQDKAIDKSKSTRDAWDQEFKIECDGTEIFVTSSGPDKEFETADDIK